MPAFSSFRIRWLMVLVVCAAAHSGHSSAKEPAVEAESKLRDYADGPLTIADFAADPPNPPPVSAGISIVASTRCRISYRYRYRAEERGGKWTAVLTEFDVTNAIEQSKSWNSRPESARILDHEQGHFDISEIGARRARAKMAELRRTGKMIGRNRDEAAAKQALEALIKSTMDENNELTSTEQKEYDRVTRHGIDEAEQADARRGQIERLKHSKPL